MENLDHTAKLYDSLQKREDLAVATFAGGCFWCIEAPLEALDGVEAVVAGYAGGDELNPTYEQVSSGETDHREAVQVFYDPSQINYSTLLDTYWLQVDPTDKGGQFADRGGHYTTAIYYHSPEQKKAAEKSKKTLDESGRYTEPVVTEVLPFKNFYLAEEYHQDYYRKNVLHYENYKRGSGRAKHIAENEKFFSKK
ncbi:MAG: Methionine-R-sulfoxide reductase [Candidatus Pacebacteria bacterium GW2011_GWB1_47_8]|nr:MAG: Methionine-R-sulfoxide reductase [Candidatus Pacebacteria bacterium GW2011_GWA1_46_10]KKU84280.1 MAG: Methionine-R-sulfoxide reductase [Candidatus Pacebacteria bacterium GW2011_GWB1_47_8]